MPHSHRPAPAYLLALCLASAAVAAAPTPTPNPQAPFPDSEISYVPEASFDPSKAFTATLPYQLCINGKISTQPPTFYYQPRTFDFGGAAPFINPKTGVNDPYLIQAWNPTSAKHENYYGSGHPYAIPAGGFPEHIEKRPDPIIDPANPNAPKETVLMIRTVKGDGVPKPGNGVTVGDPVRSQLVSYPIPPRTHARWDLSIAFGDGGQSENGKNAWIVTQSSAGHPVLFWQLKSAAQGSPPLSAIVDTDPDPKHPGKLALTFWRTTGPKIDNIVTRGKLLVVENISPGTYIPITIEAFLDERDTTPAATIPPTPAGKGRIRIAAGGQTVDFIGPTLARGDLEHSMDIGAYAYFDKSTAADYKSEYTRATFWKAARMVVYPKPSSDTRSFAAACAGQ
jgi:hypothetical protein